MKRYGVIRVAATHCGPIPPGLMILVEYDKITRAGAREHDVCFENPCGGGYSFGELVAVLSLEIPS